MSGSEIDIVQESQERPREIISYHTENRCWKEIESYRTRSPDRIVQGFDDGKGEKGKESSPKYLRYEWSPIVTERVEKKLFELRMEKGELDEYTSQFQQLAELCSGWLRLRMPGQRQKKVSERLWYLPSTMRRQVTRNALDNSGDGALTMVPLCRELSGTGDHTRKAMEVKRTSWVN